MKKIYIRFSILCHKLRNKFLTKWYGFKGKNIRFRFHLDIHRGQDISVGDDVFIDDYAEFYVVGGKLEIGNRVVIGKMNRIGCQNHIIIEDDVIMAPHVHITDRDHEFRDINTSILKQGMRFKGPTIIGRETWIGMFAQVMAGVKVGKHCVIGAGCIVTKDIPDYCVVVGNPAKIIRKYDEIKSEWVKVND